MKTRLLKLPASADSLPKAACFVIAILLLAFLAGCPDANADGVRVRENARIVHWHGQTEHHRLALQTERQRTGYWSSMSPGTVLAALPAGFVQVSAGATGYYYYEGVFFRPIASLSSGYVVVAPPMGVIVPQLPTGTELVTVGDAAYYYAGGAFYVQQPTGFAAVPAPQGAVVKTPPPGAMPVTVNGAVYFQAANAFFQPVVVGGVTLYTSVNL